MSDDAKPPKRRKPPQPGRTPDGKFMRGGATMPGAKVTSPGRMPRLMERAYVDVLMGQCSPEKWAEICALAVEDALSDNVKHREAGRRFLLRALFGTSGKGAVMQLLQINRFSGGSGEPQAAEARGLTEEDARFWREAVLMGMSGAAPRATATEERERTVIEAERIPAEPERPRAPDPQPEPQAAAEPEPKPQPQADAPPDPEAPMATDLEGADDWHSGPIDLAPAAKPPKRRVH